MPTSYGDVSRYVLRGTKRGEDALRVTGRFGLVVGLLALLTACACETRVTAAETRGDRYSARGQYADAKVEYELALEEAEESAPPELRLKAAELAVRSKDFHAADRLFGDLLERDARYAEKVHALFYLHGRRWSAQGDTFAMLRAIDWIQSRDSTANLGALYYAAGDAAFSRPDYDTAIAAYLMGLARVPEASHPAVFARLADAYEQRRDCPAALEYLGRYLEITETGANRSEEVRYRMGSCAHRLAERAFINEDYTAAARYLQTVLQSREPPNLVPGAMLMMARIHERLGDRERATVYYEQVLEIEGDRQSPAALQAFRRLKQLEFGFPLETTERLRRAVDGEAQSDSAPRSR